MTCFTLLYTSAAGLALGENIAEEDQLAVRIQGGVTLIYTVGRSATAVKVLTREILSLTLDLLLKSVLDL